MGFPSFNVTVEGWNVTLTLQTLLKANDFPCAGDGLTVCNGLTLSLANSVQALGRLALELQANVDTGSYTWPRDLDWQSPN